MNTWNAGQILSVVRTINKMDMGYLGDDPSTQNQTLFQFMNASLWKLAKLCHNTETSDTVNITADGPLQLTKGNTPITNMYEPLRLLSDVGEVPRRYFQTSPYGWYCEGPNQPIDVKGITGPHRLVYIRYPRQVTQESDPVDIPESGYTALIMEISSLLKYVKNFYEEANAMGGNAKAGYTGIAQAAIAARGGDSLTPAYSDVNKARGG